MYSTLEAAFLGGTCRSVARRCSFTDESGGTAEETQTPRSDGSVFHGKCLSSIYLLRTSAISPDCLWWKLGNIGEFMIQTAKIGMVSKELDLTVGNFYYSIRKPSLFWGGYDGDVMGYNKQQSV